MGNRTDHVDKRRAVFFQGSGYGQFGTHCLPGAGILQVNFPGGTGITEGNDCVCL